MIRWLAALALLFAAVPAWADELRPVSIQFVEVESGWWSLDWKQPLSGQRGEALGTPQIPANCEWRDTQRSREGDAVHGHAEIICNGQLREPQIGWPDFPGHGEAILRVAPLERAVQVYRLTPDEPLATIAPRASASQVWRSYFVIGVEHILTGWDHLLFVIALVLLVGRAWAVVKAATAFTVAHSLTLAAVTLGAAGLPQRPVEALIALSIVFLAVEIARGTRETLTRRLPWLVAFVFGLLHGFGFAGALREIGLPEGEVPAALISFNLGVEAGQLAVIAAVLVTLWGLRSVKPAAEARAIRLASYPIGIIGAYWLVDRVVG
ncbi:HupE/UreJ family protein [Qipengyuania sphaerica]|uniref:HupE/UreJ family protein n=1 Tax=Qipengyuania sphaerica TaxID=2867243 RepID=UPI001C867C01|nr:HupE/UreJ family protein [Qipengyuania sphaerica]MBX7539689.1 HupE/UreJ family protein [Qipengyuania sphaerica]